MPLAAIPAVVQGALIGGGASVASALIAKSGQPKGGVISPQPMFPGAQNAWLYGSSGSQTGQGALNLPQGTNAFMGGANIPSFYQSLVNARNSGYADVAPAASPTGAGGTPGIISAGGTGLGTLQSIASGVGFNDLYNAIVNQQQRSISQGEADLTEKFSAMGLRFSGPLAQAIADYKAQVSAQQGALLEDLGFRAKGMELGAAGELAQMFQQTATAMYQPGYVPSAVPGAIGGTAQMITALYPILASMNSGGGGWNVNTSGTLSQGGTGFPVAG